MKRYSTPAVPSRRLALGLLSALALLVVALRGGGFAPAVVHAAPPVITSEVNQNPPTGQAVAIGSTVVYTANITLTAAQSSAITIQLAGVSGLNYTSLICTKSGGGAAVIGIGGSPSCEFAGPFVAGTTFVYTLTATVTGAVGDPVPSAGSVVCNTASNSCSGVADATPLSDATGDVGPLSLAPAISSAQVNQNPDGGASVPLGQHVVYVATVVLTSNQAQGLAIQLRGDPNLGNRVLSCTSTSNGSPLTLSAAGNPRCAWNGPVIPGAQAGTFTFIFEGDMTGNIGDAVPAPESVTCVDTTNNGACDDELPSSKFPLADSDNDVGPLTIGGGGGGAPVVSLADVDQNPDGGAPVAVGAPVSYTVNVTLTAAQAQSLTIQLKGDANIGTRSLNCSATGNGAPAAFVATGNPACRWAGPLVTGTFTMTFSGFLTGSIGAAVPDALSVVCVDSNNNTSCDDEAPAAKVALTDANNDVGPLTVPGSGLAVTSEVDQTPPGGAAPAVGAPVSYTVSVTLTAAQALSFTIQLKGDANIGTRSLNCSATGNGAPVAFVATGNPACRWAGPVAIGTFTMTFSGFLTGSIGDAVPDAISVVCLDANSNAACDDEPPSSRIALTDANNDVGPLTVPGSGPAVISEVDQTPAGGGTPAVGSTVTYTVNVTLTAAQAQSLTIQLKGDTNLGARTINCSSVGNPAPVAAVASGNPACRWAGPVAVGTFTMTFSGQLNGAIGDAVPDPISVVCFDANNSTSCDDELPAAKSALADANGDVGPLTVAGAGTPPSVTTEVGQTPVGGSTVANGTHVVYTAQVVLTAPQTQAMTIQLRGDANLINRVLTCTSSNAGNATTVATAGNPSCMWAGPLSTGTTFFFTFSGDLSGSIGDAVPDAASVVCTDTNASNTCGDEGAAVVVALADANGDVGPLTVQGGTQYRLVVTQVAKDGINP